MNAIEAIDRPRSPAELKQMQADFMYAIGPLIKIKADIIGFATPTMLCFADGRIEHFYTYSLEQEEQLKRIDAMIEEVKDSIMKR